MQLVGKKKQQEVVCAAMIGPVTLCSPSVPERRRLDAVMSVFHLAGCPGKQAEGGKCLRLANMHLLLGEG